MVKGLMVAMDGTGCLIVILLLPPQRPNQHPAFWDAASGLVRPDIDSVAVSEEDGLPMYAQRAQLLIRVQLAIDGTKQKCLG
jgi:hypothetical protein